MHICWHRTLIGRHELPEHLFAEYLGRSLKGLESVVDAIVVKCPRPQDSET